MAFRPKNTERTGGGGDYENTSNYPVPRAGSRKARVSLIVDMGEQEREDFEDPVTKELKPQKPCDQVAVFVDLVADTVDYGGTIGKQHYRLSVNSTFKGEFKGINFQGVPQKDANGKILLDAAGKWLPYVLHPASPLTKIAKAIGKPEIIQSMDIEQLLGEPFMAQVEVKVTEAKDSKKDADGNVITYKNVNFKGAAMVPSQEDDEGNDLGPIPVGELNAEPLCITFDNAKKEDVKYIRAGLVKQIKLALNYAGSNMQKAIEAFEADKGEDDEQPAPKKGVAAKPKPAAKTTPKPKVPANTGFDDMDDDIPF
jgi:hypothetical protein